jgi:type II secretory pathway component PulJ
VVLTLGVSIVFAAVLVYTMSVSRVTSTDYAEEARIRRRETLLEEKLRKLEALREADLETLVKGSHSQVDSQAAP